MSINKVIVIGNLGRDPEVRTLPNSGKSVANLSVATKERFKDRDGNQKERTESLWNDRLRFVAVVDYAASRANNRSAELHTKEPVDEAETTIRRVGCTCG
jgi:single stranded DNA-binding protein